MPAEEHTSEDRPHSTGRDAHSAHSNVHGSTPGTAHASAPGTATSGLRAAQNHGSRNNLQASRHGSRSNLAPRTAGGASEGAAAQSDQAPPVNAVVYENTFKMKPDKKFQSEPARRIADEVLKRNLTKVKYDSEKVPTLCQTISNEILAAVKKLDYDRYKYVVDVTIGEFKGQGIRVASRAIWDTTTDSYASASFKNATLFAVAIVFGCYYE